MDRVDEKFLLEPAAEEYARRLVMLYNAWLRMDSDEQNRVNLEIYDTCLLGFAIKLFRDKRYPRGLPSGWAKNYFGDCYWELFCRRGTSKYDLYVGFGSDWDVAAHRLACYLRDKHGIEVSQ